jgi:hypothetical protein
MPDFREALKTKLEDIKRPPLLPNGTYQVQVKNYEILDEHQDYQYLDFNLMVLAPYEDTVDPEELQEFGSLPVPRRHRFLFDKNDEKKFDASKYRVKRFLLDHLKVPASEDDELGTILEQAPGAACLVTFNRRTDKNDSAVEFENIQKTMPIED